MSPSRPKAFAVVLLLLGALLAWWWLGTGRPPLQGGVAPGPVTAAQARETSFQDMLRKRFPGFDAVRADRAGQRCDEDTEVLVRQRWEALGSSDQRDHGIAHALLADKYGNAPGTSARLLAGLSAAAPGDAELLWFHANACRREHGCDARAAAQRLVDAAPENLSHWLLLVANSAQYPQGQSQWQSPPVNPEALADLLQDAAQHATQYRSRLGDGFLVAYSAMEDLPVPASCNSAQLIAARKALSAMGMRGSAVEPADSTGMAISAAMAALTHPTGDMLAGTLCQQETMPAGLLASCRAVMSQLAEGDTLLARGVGMGLLTKLDASSLTDEARAWRERYRQHRWMMEQYAQMAMETDHATLLARLSEGEVRSVQAELLRRGRWPPPADWQPRRPGP